LLAWNTEWFDDYGDDVDRIDRDLLLTKVMLYWLTGTAGSAARLYRENARRWGEAAERSTVPTAVAVFKGDGAIRRFAEPAHTITRWTEYDTGGHFAAMQTPDVLVEDIRAFFRTVRGSR
jgi:pimeloyl-ACP methyl ester carboxylesterase